MSASATTSPTRSLQAKHAAGKRWGATNTDELARDFAASKLADYIRKTVDSAPPLTAEQRDRLSLLLSGGAHA